LATFIEAIVLTTQCIVALLLHEADLEAPGAVTLRVKGSQDSGETLVESSVELLRLLSDFLPRILLGQPQVDPASATTVTPAQSDPAGFAYIKRDLVRLLGVLCHDDRESQDAVRQRNGIQLIMNMCVVDERNPYLREHALFALRNLLHNNPENQAVVDEFKPMVNWDNEGRLV